MDCTFCLVRGRVCVWLVCVEDCESGGARCCTILCDVDRLPATGSVVITVTSRLWNSTFLQVRQTASFVPACD